MKKDVIFLGTVSFHCWALFKYRLLCTYIFEEFIANFQVVEFLKIQRKTDRSNHRFTGKMDQCRTGRSQEDASFELMQNWLKLGKSESQRYGHQTSKLHIFTHEATWKELHARIIHTYYVNYVRKNATRVKTNISI